jgi:UDPglucose 6-dehydrogenase
VRIAIVGSGYVGLVTGACLADRGHAVVCTDVDPQRVALVQRGRAPFHEPGLAPLLQRHAGRRLQATVEIERAVTESDLVFICVGTPLAGDRIDLTAVQAAARRIGVGLRRVSWYQAVVVKSTVVPGTTEEVVGPILEATSGKKPGPDFGLGVNPEFLTEGEAVHDFFFPDRLVLGGVDERTIALLDDVYASFNTVPRIRTNPRTAEMIKYASNALLATSISFANEIANLCAALGGIDVADVMRGVHLSRYLTLPGGPAGDIPASIASFLWAGCGFGGSCLPKDLKAICTHGRLRGVPMQLLEAVLAVNAGQPVQLLRLLRKHHDPLSGTRVTVLGLSFRPNTDDLRESPAIPVIRSLLTEGALVTAYDPAAMPNAARLFAGESVAFADSLQQAVTKADAIIIVTCWPEFSRLPTLLQDVEPQPVVIDGRRMLDPDSVARYEGIGR